jgi:hypothetical protein
MVSPQHFTFFLFWQGISGEGGSNLPIMRTIEEIKESKGYKDALDAPRFSLGFDDVTQKSPSKSTADDSITSSMFDQLCDDAMKKSVKHQDYPTINTNHLSPEQETIYNEICKWRSRSGADTRYVGEQIKKLHMHNKTVLTSSPFVSQSGRIQVK